MKNNENNLKAKRSMAAQLQVVVLVLAGIIFGYLTFVLPGETQAKGWSAEEPVVASTGNDVIPGDPQDIDFSRFGHSNPSHTRLPCLLCHRRDDNSTRLSFPGKIEHAPCAGCHTAQIQDPASPICTICHTNPQTGAMKRFPSLKSFNARFDHGRHIRQANCATCHRSTNRGVALSIPKGAAAHNSCFQCHTQDKPIGSCSTCHTAGRPPRTSEWTKAYTVNFSHNEHIRKGNMNCASCHNVLAGAARGRQVTAPLASMHFAPAGRQSCQACHNGKRAFGANDFTNCKRCHEGKTFKF